ncbi:hypothetical protein NLU13_6031 [Sarocladium strictum]|uniref:Uncharacterized protein n=1 Tax=Sarocladium strictum TaxID=5046 RepID=A0AA39L714_SARSR|nr:hypothetical protein NLU13_6031 [Sarocladium strictum]
MPIKSLFPDVDQSLIDIWSWFAYQPREYPKDHTLLINGDNGRSYTHQQIIDLSARFGAGLAHNYSWRKGDVLGFFSPDTIDYPVVNFGVQWAGGITSPANPTYTIEELARQLKDSGARALVTQKPFLENARRAAQMVGIKNDMVWLMGEERDQTGKHKHWTEISADKAWLKPKRPSIDPAKDICYLVYSSGTTGMPKGVALTHHNMISNSRQSVRFESKGLSWDSDAQLIMLPFYHIYGLGPVLNATWNSGATAIIMSKWDVEHACRLIEKHRITFIYCPPPVILAFSKHPIVDKYDLTSLKWINSGAAPLGRSLVTGVWERLKIAVKQGYGLSETSPTTHSQFQDEFWKFQGSVGKLYPNMEAKVVDEQGNEVPQGEAGELLVKGPNVFGGYWNRPELNKDTFTEDGWFKTGDVVIVDKVGNFYITDRMKELIKYKGFQVPPAELEAHLVGRSDVADACVIGIWDEERQTEVPRAYIQLRDGVAKSEELAQEIVKWMEGHVAPPKRLRGGVRFVDVVPKSPSGKILRRLLRDQVREQEEKEKKGIQAKL